MKERPVTMGHRALLTEIKNNKRDMPSNSMKHLVLYMLKYDYQYVICRG